MRRTPCWPRCSSNFSLLWLYAYWNTWSNLDLLGQPNTILSRFSLLRNATLFEAPSVALKAGALFTPPLPGGGSPGR